jgi:hypothetical protein
MTWTTRGLLAAAAAVAAAALPSGCSSTQAKPPATVAGRSAQPTAPVTQPAVPATHAAAPATQAAAPATQPAHRETFTDPKDVNLPLDLKTLTQESSADTITYTVETYDAFRDDQADFKWAIDKNFDGVIDNYVSVEFEDHRLEGKFEDTSEHDLGTATVTRLGPATLRVSYARRLLGVSSYQYRVIAVSDLNHNDEEDPGETDVAPDNGFYAHRL